MNLRRIALASALGLALVGCSSQGKSPEPAAAATPAAAPVAQVAEAQAPAEAAETDPVVCKNIAPTGSRISKKTCMRQSQWAEAARQGREATERVQRMGNQKPVPNG